MKKASIYGILSIVALSIFIQDLHGQTYQQGHSAIELNSTLAGLTIRNTRTSSTSALRLYSDSNKNIELGIGNSTNSFLGPDVGYLFTPTGVPFEFYTGGFRRMLISADGKVGINSPTSIVDFLYVGGDTRIESGDFLVNGGTATFIKSDDRAIVASSTDSAAIRGTSEKYYGVHGISPSFFAGVYGENNNAIGTGVEGFSPSGKGTWGRSTSGTGVYGTSTDSRAVWGASTNDYGIFGTTTVITRAGVWGEGPGTGVQGFGIGVGDGVVGSSLGGHGVVGRSTDAGNGQFDFYADGSSMDWGSSSSRRWKENIETIVDPVEKVSNLRGVYFDWDQAHGGRHDIGFIAEEVGVIIPEIVSYEENGIDAIAVDYTKVAPLLVEAIKEMKMRFDEELKDLRAQVVELKSLILESNGSR